MLRPRKVRSLHHAFVEVTDVLVSHEVRGFAEAHVVGSCAVDIVHQHVTVGAEAFEHVGSFRGNRLGIDAFGLGPVSLVDLVGDGMQTNSIAMEKFLNF
jgi:hypothetical protein